MRTVTNILAACLLLAASAFAHAFDHEHAAWDALLKRHVVVAADGKSSAVNYAGMQRERGALKAYLDTLTAVSERDYESWSAPRQLAFLINAYNAFTVERILGSYPKLASIKDLGTPLRSAWRKRFFTLLGRERHLDELEHELIRAPGVFDEPRIHVALVCASIGCPMLRDEAWTAERLGTQFEDAMRRFLSDRSRNRFDAARGTLFVSKLFDWYGKDFEQGHQGFDSLKRTFARYAEQLADTPEARARLRAGQFRVDFLEYDWALNDVR